MAAGHRRTLSARIGAILGFICGLLGLVAGYTDHVWRFGVTGWFSGGSLLVLLALFALVDGSVASQKTHER